MGPFFYCHNFFLSNGRWLCDMMFYLLVEYILRSMGLHKKDVTPLLTHWRYVIIALTYWHEHVVCHRINFGKCEGVHHIVWSYKQHDWGFFCKKCKNKYIKHYELYHYIFCVNLCYLAGSCGAELGAFASDISPDNFAIFQYILPGFTCGELTQDPDDNGNIFNIYTSLYLVCGYQAAY